MATRTALSWAAILVLAAAPATAQPHRGGPGPGSMMSASEHGTIRDLLGGHAEIERAVTEIPDGVRTVTTTGRPELVEALRRHVRQMESRLREGRPVRIWDPAFRDVFAHADAIRIEERDVEGGIEVVETTDDPAVVPIIRAHARAVSRFVAGGHEAARPPWAGRGMGMGGMMGMGAGPFAVAGEPEAAPDAEAPSDASAPLRAVIHVNFDDVKRQEGGLRNVGNILKEGEAELEVVCHSGGIGLVMAGKSPQPERVAELIERGVRFVACENTMREKGITPDDLLPGVGTVPSGAVEVIRKQHEGFAYFRP